ncbi:hypothetical protein EV644_10754 [Kribbella orskensis]|uniref:Uncharacterized protein n=1 Tax=Kribbella orskensis TaxID=2512216 RepID=A0ABY2BL37_9ACTN|nr:MULTISPECIES: hypothetical protein [Kribbella]TCN39085.1 hypothetical protein EV642_10754 [Kribbella sp. VKM Ac-2500]TCO21732.1 hypothetical protein EV644_10754 [Kribbella orskensis]
MGRPNVKHKNGALAVGVAAAAVLAVFSGGALAAQRGPTAGGRGAAPLPAGPSPTASSPKPSATPSSTPSTKPAPKPTPSRPGIPATVTIDLAKLQLGRAPQQPYLEGRVVKGGPGTDHTIPGKQNILQALQFGTQLIALLEVGEGGSELVTVDTNAGRPGFGPLRIPDVASLAGSLDVTEYAFATAPQNPDHTRAKGSAVYWSNGLPLPDEKEFPSRKLERPNDWGSRVLAVVGDTVYFASDTDPNGITSALNEWNSKTGKVTRLRSFKSPFRVDYQGRTGVDQIAGAAQTFCSALREVDNGKQLWRTCEYALNGFTPDGRTVYATPDFRGGGSDPFTAALDAWTGELRRKWAGAQFLHALAEDDDHLLMVADNGEGTKSAIIRCSITTGGCELATPLTKIPRHDLRLLGAQA